MIGLLLKSEHHGAEAAETGAFARFHRGFEQGFERLRAGYVELLHLLLTRRLIVPLIAVLVLTLGAVMFVFVGRDFFPDIDGGRIQLHLRAPPATRIETTEQIFQAVENKIREVVPKDEVDLIVDNIGLPARLYNLAFADGTTIGVTA
jgi:multidrug efflux pump subunit AcrB